MKPSAGKNPSAKGKTLVTEVGFDKSRHSKETKSDRLQTGWPKRSNRVTERRRGRTPKAEELISLSGPLHRHNESGSVEAHAQPTSSARRRRTARARWLRMITDNSCSRSLCKVAESSPVRAAALQAICSRSWLAARSHAPVDSATKGTNCTPCWLQRWAVFK